MSRLALHVGVKADPIEYRYSYEWLFGLLAEEGIHHVQLGSFFEMYQLPDRVFARLRRRAEDFGVVVSSVFGAHRDLGGFLRGEPEWEEITRRNHRRMVEIGVLVGARSIGCNMGAVLRDRMELKAGGVARHLQHMKDMMHYAHDKGLPWLALEPMSCLAEPPTLPDEIREVAEELVSYHGEHRDDTCRFGYCQDVAHGYADEQGKVVWSAMQVLEAALPYLSEIHLKNTDARFEATFGFSDDEQAMGTVDVAAVRDLLLARADTLPVREVVGYFETGGPKTGRDYSDCRLADHLRKSLRYLKRTFRADASPQGTGRASTL